jgi:HEAT repeat protein
MFYALRISTMQSVLLLSAICLVATGIETQTPIDGIDARTDASQLGRQLGDRDPLLRQKSAEALARLAAVDQLKVVQGYQLQEKNKEVRLALEWALYRMGKSDHLYRIVEELDSGRQSQAIGYLSELESPDLLYPFLQKANNPAKVNAGLLKALARIGDAKTLELVDPLRESLQPNVAEAAELAHDEIEKRLAQTGPTMPVRPRTTGKPQPE